MAIDPDGEGEIIELNYGHWVEVQQAAYIVQSNHQAFLVDHPAIAQTPALAGKADVINRLLGELYQAIGEAGEGPGDGHE